MGVALAAKYPNIVIPAKAGIQLIKKAWIPDKRIALSGMTL